MPVPSRKQLAALTETALQNMHYPKLAEALLPARPGQPARPVPERVGEPSVFKHVIYVIKENRTYDQILGDMPEGNGDANLCIFGEKYTPNQHKIAREFVLLDNTYCSGVQSADGHQWTDSAIANEYVERQLTSEHPAQLPGRQERGQRRCAGLGLLRLHLGQRPGARQDLPQLRRMDDFRSRLEGPEAQGPASTWQDFWQRLPDRRRAGAAPAAGRASRSLRQHSNTNTVGWDLKVPDVMRAAEFIRELRQFETNGGFPNLIILFLPNDHTGGTRGQYPTPGRAGRRQRSGLRAGGRGAQPQPVLAGDLPVRHRRRPAGRLGSRERLSHDLLRRQPLHQAPADHQHAIQPDQPDAHDRVDPRPAAR